MYLLEYAAPPPGSSSGDDERDAADQTGKEKNSRARYHMKQMPDRLGSHRSRNRHNDCVRVDGIAMPVVDDRGNERAEDDHRNECHGASANEVRGESEKLQSDNRVSRAGVERRALSRRARRVQTSELDHAPTTYDRGEQSREERGRQRAA